MDVLVIANTKKRPMEMAGETRYCFNECFSYAVGDWWFKYAAEESIWLRIRNGQEVGIGAYQRALLSDEAEAILRDELAEFETMPMSDLATKVGHDEVRDRVCSKGLPVKVEIQVYFYDWSEPTFSIGGSIKDRVLRGAVSHSVYRKLNTEQIDCNQ